LTSLKQQGFSQETHLVIYDGDMPAIVNYSDLVASHKGNSWFGCSVGFRAMQMAAEEFAKQVSWARGGLYIVSGHPGPGVKDAINLVTQCISDRSFCLLDETVGNHCSRKMRFEWWITNNDSTIHIELHKGLVPDHFYTLLDRLNTTDEEPQDKSNFEQYKINLSELIWQQPLDQLFSVDVLPEKLRAGELPNA